MNIMTKLSSLQLDANPESMFTRIMSNPDVYYRSEQRGDSDLDDDEKRTTLQSLFSENPKRFLSIYHRYMAVEDCGCFDLNCYENAIFAKEIYERCGSVAFARQNKDILFRNQRYAEMNRLKKETDYFSYAKMREREPLLFDKLIGRFLPEAEQPCLRPTIENDSLSGILMQFEDSKVIADRRNAQLDEWNDLFQKKDGNDIHERLALHMSSRFCQNFENGDLDDNDDDDEDPTSSYSGDSDKTATKDVYVSNYSIAMLADENVMNQSDEDCDQEQLKADFTDHMEQRFLKGEDVMFYDYSTIGTSRSMEYEKMRNQDLEDAYFDSD